MTADPVTADIAAIDLGSNSFHLLIARPSEDGFVEVERLKDKVQLLHGLRAGRLHDDAMQRGRLCLARFAQRLRQTSIQRVVVMGTQALRMADNGADYANDLSTLLRVPVQVITGEQEAQLIYSAVARRTAWMQSPKLVLDIGGGSTEIALGQDLSSDQQISVGIGCVGFKDAFFSESGVVGSQLEAATAHAQAMLQQTIDEHPEFAEQLRRYMAQGALCFGTSGTVESIMTVLAANGWIDEAVTPAALDRLNAALLEDRWVVDAGLPGLAPDRADIFPGGVAILSACMKVLGVQELNYAGVSLLHGIVYESLFDKPSNEAPNEKSTADTTAIKGSAKAPVDESAIDSSLVDVRDASVQRLANQFGVDAAQAQRVRKTAEELYQQCSAWHAQLPDSSDQSAYAKLLAWSAMLHELGVHINASHYHRHGGYVVKHAQLPGFSDLQRNMLALMIRGHRRSMPEIAFRAFSSEHQRHLFRILVVLRLAVILQRSHADADVPQVAFSVTDDVLDLEVGADWLDEHPLSARELEVEAVQLSRAGLTLRVS